MFTKKSSLVRKPILLGKENEVKQAEQSKVITETRVPIISSKREVIAVTGVTNGVGSTHIALSIAYVLSKAYSVALVELDEKKDLQGFNETYDLRNGKLNSKKLEELDVYFFGENDLIEILKQKYDFIILDLGKCIYKDEQGIIKAKSILDEAYRADYKILVTQTKEWQLKYLADFIKYDQEMKDWIVLANLSSIKEYKELKQIFNSTQSKVIQIPYIEDVFNCEGELKVFNLLNKEVKG